MVEHLSNIIPTFPGAANRARCTAHIVNLVAKVILRQFDATHARKKTKQPKKTSENTNDNENANVNEANNTELVSDEDDLTGLAEGLDREEQEVADDEDDDMSENIAADLEDIEEAMKDEISEVAKKVKPIQRIMFKVHNFIILGTLSHYILTSFF